MLKYIKSPLIGDAMSTLSRISSIFTNFTFQIHCWNKWFHLLCKFVLELPSITWSPRRISIFIFLKNSRVLILNHLWAIYWRLKWAFNVKCKLYALPSFLNLTSSSARRPFGPLVPNIFKANWSSKVPKLISSDISINWNIFGSSVECQDTVIVRIFRRCDFQISFKESLI